jgi:hypothetical protein
MSSTSVFWPKTGIRRDRGLVLGLRLDDVVVVVVVAIVEEWVSTKAGKEADIRWTTGLIVIPT